MPNTYPNQRLVRIHREAAKSDFLGIKNANWQAAARDLRPHALLLYLYFAANANDFQLALSPAAVREAVGMARSTFSDQFQILVDKGYLVSEGGNKYSFYEVPRPRTVQERSMPSLGNDAENPSPTVENSVTAVSTTCPTKDREINNTTNKKIDTGINIEDFIPKVKTITIPRPVAEGTKPIPKLEQKEYLF